MIGSWAARRERAIRLNLLKRASLMLGQGPLWCECHRITRGRISWSWKGLPTFWLTMVVASTMVAPSGMSSEMINSVTSKRSSLWRGLGTLLLAITSLAMLWAWTTEAGLFLLAWCGLLRIGEAFAAKRHDLILPIDGAPGLQCVLVRISTPKTRGRTARHQSDQSLWPMSSSTLRKRLNLLQAALGMPTARSHEICPFDLGSFRPGGATDLLQQFEDSELVRRRGRWVSNKVLEFYLQEVSTATFHTKLSVDTRKKIEKLSTAFTDIRRQCQNFILADIPTIAWRHLWSTPAWGWKSWNVWKCFWAFCPQLKSGC